MYPPPLQEIPGCANGPFPHLLQEVELDPSEVKLLYIYQIQLVLFRSHLR